MSVCAKDLGLDALDPRAFEEHVVQLYLHGQQDTQLPADANIARSLIAAGSGAIRDFSYVGTNLPVYKKENCIGCLDCVVQCPDNAIYAKVQTEEEFEKRLAGFNADDQAIIRTKLANTQKYGSNLEKKGIKPALFGLFIDPTRCKACGLCAAVCGRKGALEMTPKSEKVLAEAKTAMKLYQATAYTPKEYILEKSLNDMMLRPEAQLFVGGAGSCMGCGETTAMRMLLAATAHVYGKDGIGLVAATGCNTVFSSTFPFNPYKVPWSNSLFENVATMGLGVYARWEQLGWGEKRLWCIGGDGAMFDIGFQALSRVLASGKDVKIMVLDSQVYSNTGGQASTATFTGQDAKLSAHGKTIKGKVEMRKELGNICMFHPNTFVAQVSPSHPNHMFKAIMAANDFPGPAVVICYISCATEHGTGDDTAFQQAKWAVESRAFPLYVYDPRKGERIDERLDLAGNLNPKEDWTKNPKSGEPFTFTDFAKTEGRFRKHFDKEGKPSAELIAAENDRLKNWRMLQELAGLK